MASCVPGRGGASVALTTIRLSPPGRCGDYISQRASRGAGRGGGGRKEAPRVQCAGVSPLWLYKGGFGAARSFAFSALSLLHLGSSVSPPMSSHPGNQGLLLYVVS